MGGMFVVQYKDEKNWVYLCGRSGVSSEVESLPQVGYVFNHAVPYAAEKMQYKVVGYKMQNDMSYDVIIERHYDEPKTTLRKSDVFNSKRVFPAMYYECVQYARDGGFKYLEFNGMVFDRTTGSPEFGNCVCMYDELGES